MEMSDFLFFVVSQVISTEEDTMRQIQGWILATHTHLILMSGFNTSPEMEFGSDWQTRKLIRDFWII